MNADLDAIVRLVAEDRFVRWGYDKAYGEEGRARFVEGGLTDPNLRADITVIWAEAERRSEALRARLTRTQDREMQHARILREVERIAGELDGTGAVDGGEVAEALRAAYRAGAEER